MNSTGTSAATVPAQSDATATYRAAANATSGDENLHAISILVENRVGILARVTHVFARRGFNIETLTVSATEDPTTSLIAVVASGDDVGFEPIGKQLLKLIDVLEVIDFREGNAIGDGQ